MFGKNKNSKTFIGFSVKTTNFNLNFIDTVNAG